jgi:hypothetical protein
MTEIDSTLDPFVEAEIKEHHGFCASSSAKGGHLSWGYAAWRIWVFLCSLRSFMLR